MKKTSILFLAITVALIGITSHASAEMKSANYMLLKGGLYSPSESHNINDFNGGSSTQLDSKTGFAAEIAAGHYFLPMLALEVGVGYFESKGSPAAQPGETKLKVVPVIATAKVLLPLGPFEPYGMFGIGAYISDLDAKGNTSNFRGSTEVTYGLHAGAGLNINFSDTMFVDFEGKYIWAEPTFSGQHVKLDGFITTAGIGLRF